MAAFIWQRFNISQGLAITHAIEAEQGRRHGAQLGVRLAVHELAPIWRCVITAVHRDIACGEAQHLLGPLEIGNRVGIFDQGRHFGLGYLFDLLPQLAALQPGEKRASSGWHVPGRAH